MKEGLVLMYDYISNAVAAVRRKTDAADPIELCRDLGILLRRPSLGTMPGALKGFYTMHYRIKAITVNGDLPEAFQRTIIAHEIGHAELHASHGYNEFHDGCMFDISSVMEKEANLFAAELLLKDEDILPVLSGDTTLTAAAAELLVPIELLDFKFRVMKSRGYRLAESSIEAHNNFLKKLEVPFDADYWEGL